MSEQEKYRASEGEESGPLERSALQEDFLRCERVCKTLGIEGPFYGCTVYEWGTPWREVPFTEEKYRALASFIDWGEKQLDDEFMEMGLPQPLLDLGDEVYCAALIDAAEKELNVAAGSIASKKRGNRQVCKARQYALTAARSLSPSPKPRRRPCGPTRRSPGTNSLISGRLAKFRHDSV